MLNNQKKQCECCQKSYSSSYWTRHIKTHKHIRNSIPTINQEPIIKTILVIKKAPCEICSKMITITNMSRHRNIHNTPKIIEVIAEFKCPIAGCKRKSNGYKSQKALDKHVANHPDNNKKVYKYWCKICDNPIRDEANRKTHIASTPHLNNLCDKYGVNYKHHD